jgi:hypothetical protein
MGFAHFAAKLFFSVAGRSCSLGHKEHLPLS